MKAIIVKTLIFLLLVFAGTLAFAQKDAHHNYKSEKDTTITLSLGGLTGDDEEEKEKVDSLIDAFSSEESLLKFSKPWRVKKGDDEAWIKPGYIDDDWIELTSDSAQKAFLDKGSVYWFRNGFEIDTSLMNKPLALYVRQFGSAVDVYLDGKFLKSFGKTGNNRENEIAEFSINPRPFAFTFTNKKDHVFAIRYSNFHRTESKQAKFNIGKNFKIIVKELNGEIAEVADPSQYFPLIFFSAIFLTLGVFHMVIFIYNRQIKSNFSYSIYCFGIFAITYYIYYMLNSSDYEVVTMMLKVLLYVVPLIVVPLVSMIHRVFYGKRLKIFWVIIALFVISLILYSYGMYSNAGMIVIATVMLSTIEIIRVIVKAIRRKKDGAWIFAFIILLAPLAGIISSYLPDQFVIGGMKIPNNTSAIVGSCFILGLPFSMTLYLARDFSRLNKRLKEQLKENTDLSEKTIRQEKEKKQILENQKTELEIKVAERTREVIQQKNVIEIKNKEITDSLNYAKRIQSAILPDVTLIHKTLQQSFILYLPKDIVSGDFYAFAHKENKVLIAAADCTGHGVAGAFMSMIGSSLLNQIINEKNITEPAPILDQLNAGIIHALKQKENESSDGMDISICTFDFNKNELLFAGANRPLWMIRNNELRFYKPNKFPIGGLQVESDEKFSQHVIALQKNDTIYIFSDGYADQFGGEKGKKLMTRRFRETLLSIQKQTMEEQEIYLKEYFQSWKGNNEQVDDVLVIGIRV